MKAIMRYNDPENPQSSQLPFCQFELICFLVGAFFLFPPVRDHLFFLWFHFLKTCVVLSFFFGGVIFSFLTKKIMTLISLAFDFIDITHCALPYFFLPKRLQYVR
jgi:hypothetical protein